MNSPARSTALNVLSACRRSDAWSDGTLKAAISRSGLDSRDAALATNICYGVLQNRALLDFYIASYCSIKPERLDPLVLDILRIGAYQIVFLDKIPPSAAVNEAVEMAKNRKKSKASGLVNAVLRKIVQNRDALPPIQGTGAQKLALQYSHPLWLCERMVALLGEEEAESFLRCNNGAVPTTIQHNPLRMTREELLSDFHANGVLAAAHPWLSDCWELSHTGSMESLASFQRGGFMVQDAAAKLVSVVSAVQPGMRVLDACAAPGGKSFGAAIAMQNRGSIVSCDIHPHKLRLIERSAERLGVICIETALADGREYQSQWQDAFDVVICDVPCSGLGIIRKKPDIRYKDAAALAALPTVQSAILSNVARYVRPGGVLIYSTCTVLPEENEGVTDAFLRTHPDFSCEAFSLPEPVGTVDGRITLWPQRHSTDGFYICRFRRN